MEEDVLKGGEKELLDFKDLVQSLEQSEKEVKDAETKEKEKQKQIEKKERDMECEIADYEKKARESVAKPYDEEIANLERDKKSSISAKGKKKQEEIKRLGEEATTELREKYNETEEKMKQLAEEDGISSVFRNRMFYSVYYPMGVTDFLFLTCFLAVWFAVLPFVCRWGLYQAGIELTMSDIYLVFVLIFFAIYVLINNYVKEKHMETYHKLNDLREEINQINKEIRSILAATKKTSEQDLGLQEFDFKVQELDKTLIDKRGTRERELKAFDENKEAKEERAAVIREMYQTDMDQLTSELEQLTTDKEQKSAVRDELLGKVNSEYYKPLLDAEKNIRKVKVMEELFVLLRTGEAKTIADAIEKRKKPKAAKEEN